MGGDREDLDSRWPATLRFALPRILAPLDVAPLEVASEPAAHLALGPLARLIDRMPRRPCDPLAASVCSEPRACRTSLIERLMLATEARLPRGYGCGQRPGEFSRKWVASDTSVRRARFGQDKATALTRLSGNLGPVVRFAIGPLLMAHPSANSIETRTGRRDPQASASRPSRTRHACPHCVHTTPINDANC